MTLVNSRLIICKRLLGLRLRKRIVIPAVSDTSVKHYSSNGELSDTTLLVQNGIDIQELPLVVKRISSIEASHLLFCSSNDTNSSGSDNSIEAPPSKEELEEMINGFRRCCSIHEVLKLLEVVPSTYVKPDVAFHIVEKIIELDHSYSIGDEGHGVDDVTKNFTKTAVFNQLMGIVLSNKEDYGVLVKCLKLMHQQGVYSQYLKPYEDKLDEQILINVTQNKFSLADICEIVTKFHYAGKRINVDRMWVGVTENAKNIDEKNIMNVFQILPYFKTSRQIVANTLIKKMSDVWWYIDGRDVADILAITEETNTYSHQLLEILGRWINTKIHSVTEDELMLIIGGFSRLNFVNAQIISALERYIRMRTDLIENASLFGTIMDYCLQFRIRSSMIFDKACDYFIARGNSLPPTVFKSLFVPFGRLHYQPYRSFEFWKQFEELLQQKLTSFQPEHIVDIMLSCVLLEKYPINFVNYVFNPYFLNKLQADCRNWPVTKRNLIMFDHVMSVECPAYLGPLLPKKYPPETIVTDVRLQTFVSRYRDTLKSIVQNRYRVVYNKCLRWCPLHNDCVVDILLVPRGVQYDSIHEIKSSSIPIVAVLIHTPDHFCYNQENELVGTQVMRERHLRKYGLKVVHLKYLQLFKFGNGRNHLLQFINDAVLDCSDSN